MVSAQTQRICTALPNSLSTCLGPFWVSTTLVFVLAIAGNLASYFAATSKDRSVWHYDFQKGKENGLHVLLCVGLHVPVPCPRAQ